MNQVTKIALLKTLGYVGSICASSLIIGGVNSLIKSSEKEDDSTTEEEEAE